MRRLAAVAIVALAACARTADAQSPQAVLERAVTEFEQGRFEASVSTFDTLVSMLPGREADLWQRGIVLYYAGRYADCRRQFELHRTVNPDDVENAAWHFVCVARQQNPEAARKALLPVGPDSRVPMREIYQMFAGKIRPDEMMRVAGSAPGARFYAELYAGLYYEALGDGQLAVKHIKAAAADQYAGVGGYMHMVARVHLRTLER